ncbi:uncharacterized protein JCM10292_001590 [Rhodotorula paludigena]|uniref:uncharacterized protein n=1 Tax=Rhodotorula paludigena TaxID=86838 RepID=UPI00316C1194
MPFPARNEPDDLVGAMAGMSVGEHRPMIRPNTGTVGHKYPVLTNTYQVKPPEIICYHYDVRITPDKTPPRLNRKVWEHLDKVMGVFKGIAIAYDGRSMAYSPKKLPADEGQFSITLPDEDGGGRNGSGSARDFSVKIRFTRPIDLARLGVFVRGELRGQADEPDPSEVQSAIQAVNILIQHGPSMLYPSKSASFFLPPANPQAASLSKGLTMWRGYTTSLRMGPSKLFLNLDIASQPMVQMGSLPDVVLNYLKGTNRNLTFAQLSARNIPPAEYIKLGRFLKGLKVKLVVKDADGYQPTRKIRGIVKFSANDPATQFEADGKTHTIESYFASVYNVRLQRPDFPVVLVSKTARWPLELCYVEMGQKWTRKLDPEQTADAIRLTTVGPSDRLNMLSQGLKRIQPSDTALGQWGVEINPNPIQAMARELPQPQINYKRRVFCCVSEMDATTG